LDRISDCEHILPLTLVMPWIDYPPPRLNGSIALSITYGYKVSNKHDRFVALAEKVVADVTSALVPGAFLVDTIPAREAFLNEPV
jgi:hypothetical protein